MNKVKVDIVKSEWVKRNTEKITQNATHTPLHLHD